MHPKHGATRTRRSSTRQVAIATFLLGCLLAACGNDPKSARGFRLPDGNVDAGKAAFVDLRCYVCHTAPGIDARYEGTPAAVVPLGGSVTRVRSYGELVTAIINPSHRVVLRVPRAPPPPTEAAPMELAALNGQMTVQQLVDLVAFLQGTYRVVPPATDPYVYVYP